MSNDHQVSSLFRVFYVLTLLTWIFPRVQTLVAKGGGLASWPEITLLATFVPLSLLALVRVYLVVKHRTVLSSPNGEELMGVIRAIGMLLIFLSPIIYLLHVCAPMYLRYVGAGAVSWVLYWTGLVADRFGVAFVGPHLIGILTFEASRLFAFERRLQSPSTRIA